MQAEVIWNNVDNLMPLRHKFVLVETPYCRYPFTVAFYNGVDWVAADDVKTLNVQLWVDIKAPTERNKSQLSLI